MKVCTYCGQEIDPRHRACPNCGGSLEEQEPQPWWKSLPNPDPFFYNGYMVWMTYEDRWARAHRCSWYFYLGDRLVEVITLDRDVVRKFVPEGQSVMPFVWDLFKVAQGEEEALRVEEQNRRNPAVFEIRRVKSEREEWVEGLTFDKLAQAMFARGVP